MGGKSGKEGADPGNCGRVIITRDDWLNHTYFCVILYTFGLRHVVPGVLAGRRLLAKQRPVQMRKRQPLDQLRLSTPGPGLRIPGSTPRTVRSVPSASGGFLAGRRGTLLANVYCSVLACARPLLVFLQGTLREEGTGRGIFVQRRQDSRRSLPQSSLATASPESKTISITDARHRTVITTQHLDSHHAFDEHWHPLP
jgi:hypothetical protein